MFGAAWSAGAGSGVSICLVGCCEVVVVLASGSGAGSAAGDERARARASAQHWGAVLTVRGVPVKAPAAMRARIAAGMCPNARASSWSLVGQTASLLASTANLVVLARLIGPVG